MFEKILVPTDFTDEADRVLTFAKGLKAFGLREITLVHVVDVGRAVVWPLPGALSGAIEAKLEERRGQLEGEGFVARTLLLEGSPSDEVLKAAVDGDYSMIVTGSHGKRLIEEILLGSVSEAISRESKIPVLVVRYDVLRDIERGKPLGQYAAEIFRKVLVPNDFSSVSNQALDVVRMLRKAGVKDVVTLHIVDAKRLETETEKTEQLEACTAATGKVVSRLQGDGFAVEAVCRVGDPLTEILSVAEEVNASLIVMGSHGKGIFKEWLIGSVSLNVIRTADRPALVVYQA